MQWVLCLLLTLAATSWGKVTEVTLYPAGALITEEKALTLKEGQTEIEWGTLAQGVDVESIRVNFEGGVKARLLDRQARREQVAYQTDARRAELLKLTESVEQKLKAAADEMAVINANENYLNQIQTASTQPVKGEVAYTFGAPAQWQSLMDFVAQGRAKLFKDKRANELAQKELRKEYDRLARELNDLNGQETLFEQKLVLQIEALKAGSTTAKLTYFDPNAGWRPTYQVWVDSASKAIQLTYAAYARQGTGSDWTDVVLKLSTARPNASATPPELSAWWITEQPVYPMAGNVRMLKSAVRMESVNMAATPAMMEDKAEMMASNFAQATVEQKLSFVELTIPVKVTLASDNTGKRFVVSEIPMKGELSYKLVPELSKEAYLQARVVNSSAMPILAGESQLYVNGSFVGRSYLKQEEPGMAFDLNLGVDPAVRLERKLLEKKTELTGLMEDSRKITYRYELTVENVKSAEVAVSLVERLPVSQHEKIKVELLSPKKLSDKIDKEGKLKIDLTLKAKEKQVIELSYSVEHPKKMEVQGL